VKIRTRAFLLGLVPTLLVALVLTIFHVHNRLKDLDDTMMQQGTALARHLASAAEYGVFSGNRTALENLLAQAVEEPWVTGAMVVWPDHTELTRGEPNQQLPPLGSDMRWQDDKRSWFASAVTPGLAAEDDPFVERPAGTPSPPLAWVVVGIDLKQKEALASELLLASLVLTLAGIVLAVLLINRLALSGVKPLLDIVSTVKHISSGGFGTHMAVTAGSPELRELQIMINRMSESLRAYKEEMEARVHAVTAELAYKKREAEQASLAKSRFLAAASHDLRQPMHAISLYVESLKPDLRGRAGEDTLEKIERSILSMVELFNAILDVTRLDAGVIQPVLAPVRIRQLLLSLAESFAVEADRKGLSLRVRAPDVWIESDPILLERILRNLLSNALLHTTQGGVLLSARPCQGRLRLRVWDTGCGIPAEQQPRIFDEFYQGDSQNGGQSGHGLGLGLAIVRRLARLLQHPLQLDSRPGQGTVFSLDVPLTVADARPAPATPEARHPALSGRVVVVDDEPAVREALTRLLVQWGIEAQAFAGLDEVQQMLQHAPDLVLADYQLLDGATGLDVIEAMRARWGQGIPAVVITGDTRADTVQQLAGQPLHVLYKPVHPAQLAELLQQLLPARPRPDSQPE
jgi:signal transduction histidine kinase/ActR/RegA family two-component response regulator